LQLESGTISPKRVALYDRNNQVNNQSVRKRFNIAKNNVSFASKIITDTLDAGLIKASDPDNASKKFASYVPFWT
jgi:ATP-dependent DNA helicase RecG